MNNHIRHKTRSAVAEAIGGGPRDTPTIPLHSRVLGAALGYMIEVGVRLYQRITR